ncbi:MAG: DUF4349 domain-containing protein [Oscillospiraceae bacterium]|nr:DUF4349 domain-containing protein [Oscillospiraceae bacterium]MBR6096396.1 DUF4349 domain-containing protein [Oscillospiraceae bacterium]
MKRMGLRVAALLLAAALLLSGCGASAMPSNQAAEDSWSYATSDGAESWGYYEAEAPAEAVPDRAPGNVKMIYTADVELESVDFDAAANALAALTAELGGWYESSQLNNRSRYRSASYTVRVPAEQFSGFCARVGEAAALRSLSRSAEDVSERYYDQEARLSTQRTKLERLQALLERAEAMEDIIALESAIAETELVIENLTGSLRHYDSLVGYATVRVRLQEVSRETETETAPIGFGARLADALRSGATGFVSGLEDVLVALAGVWAGLLCLALLAVAAVLLLRRHGKKHSAAQQPPTDADGNGKQAK